MSDDQNRNQQLIDALQVIAPTAQRLVAAARQQEQDAQQLLAAAERAVALVKPQEGGSR